MNLRKSLSTASHCITLIDDNNKKIMLTKECSKNLLMINEHSYDKSYQKITIYIFGSFAIGKSKVINDIFKNEIFAPKDNFGEAFPFCIFIIRELDGNYFIKHQTQKEVFDNLDLVSLPVGVERNHYLKGGTEIIILPDNTINVLNCTKNILRSGSHLYILPIRGTVTSEDRIQYQHLVTFMENMDIFVLVYDREGIGWSSELDRTEIKESIATQFNDFCRGSSIRHVNIAGIFFISTVPRQTGSDKCALGETVDEFDEFEKALSSWIKKISLENTPLPLENKPGPLEKCSIIPTPKKSATGRKNRKKPSAMQMASLPSTRSLFANRQEMGMYHNQAGQSMSFDSSLIGSKKESKDNPSSPLSPSIATSVHSAELDEPTRKTSDQIDEPSRNTDNNSKMHASLVKTYKKLMTGFETCNECNNRKSNIQDLLLKVKDFLDLYHSFFRRKSMKTVCSSEGSDENEKLSLNCLCLSINIVNLLMDHVPKSSGIIPRLFRYLGDFESQDKSDRIARRMQESILYCLCNYYDNQIQQKLKIRKYNSKWRSTLNLCFSHNQNSNKIKLSAAISLSFIWQPDVFLNGQILDYLIKIKSTYIKNETDRYLGIRGNVIETAIQNLS